ncbi:hypothetical protein T07_11856 [Trichinella nelsoni]|uniref:Uncharacterized protein n=1 Tax=Trichinella nelsoni TaxID=6336 RepID=A0A0V0RXH9_9BILA|nr:hypothetical protein T07_11856 [Trichinella nelsoni]
MVKEVGGHCVGLAALWTEQRGRTSPGRCVDWIRFSIDDSQATPALFGLFEIIQSTIKLTLERPRGKAAVQLWNRFSKADDFSLLAKVAVAYLRVSLHAGEWLRRIDDDDDDSDSDVD